MAAAGKVPEMLEKLGKGSSIAQADEIWFEAAVAGGKSAPTIKKNIKNKVLLKLKKYGKVLLE